MNRPIFRILLLVSMFMAVCILPGVPKSAVASSYSLGTEIIVEADTDPSTDDGYLIKNAIAAANPGDTITLVGEFNLGTPDGTELTIPLPDGDSFQSAWGVDLGTQWFLIDKPLTVRGVLAPDGETATILTVSKKFSEHQFDADDPEFIIASNDVTMERLVFDGPLYPVTAFWAGFTIRECVLRNTGYGVILVADERSVYLNYPVDRSRPNKSLVQGNRFSNVPRPVIIGCSAVTVKKNTFEGPSTEPGMPEVGVNIYAGIDWAWFYPELQRGTAENNLIVNNSFSGFDRAVFVHADGPVRDNVIATNDIHDCGGGVILWAGALAYADGVYWMGADAGTLEGNLVADNIIRSDIDYGMAAILVNGGIGNQVTGNRIYRSGGRPGIWVDWGFSDLPPGSPGSFPSFLMIPGRNTLISGNTITGASIGILIGDFVHGSLVKGNMVHDSTLADYALNPPGDLWYDGSLAMQFGPPSGNLLKIQGPASILDMSGCSNVDSCVQWDDDQDGAYSEDVSDRSNNDGDYFLSFRHDYEGRQVYVIDEDPRELPNRIEANPGGKITWLTSQPAINRLGDDQDVKQSAKLGLLRTEELISPCHWRSLGDPETK